MKITRKSGNEVRFDDLRVGDVFRYGQYICLRIRELMNDDEEGVKAIGLINGDPVYIEPYEVVTKLEAELIVSMD